MIILFLILVLFNELIIFYFIDIVVSDTDDILLTFGIIRMLVPHFVGLSATGTVSILNRTIQILLITNRLVDIMFFNQDFDSALNNDINMSDFLFGSVYDISFGILFHLDRLQYLVLSFVVLG